MALTDLGRFAEAMVTNAEALSIARKLRDVWREISSIAALGQVCVAMAQWDVAARYYEQARDLSEQKHEEFLELLNRLNLADCFLQLRDAALACARSGAFQQVASSQEGLNPRRRRPQHTCTPALAERRC